jgi:type I restriction enzyme S subunit
MVIQEGYKQTEIGVIPMDWKIDYVKNLALIKTGSRNTQDKIENGLYPFFVRSQTIESINSYSFDGEAVLTAGDGVGVGKVIHYVNEKFDCHQRVYRISNFVSNLNGYFFYLYFSNNFYNRIMQMTAKSSVDSVRMDMIANMFIPIPPTLTEQTAIATALSDVDGLITGLEKLIAKKRNIKQGAMQQLLQPKDGWEVKKLGEVCLILNNLRIPIKESSRIQGYIEGFTHCGEFVLVAEDGANDLNNYPINYIQGKIWVNNHAHVLQGIASILKTSFLSYLLKSIDFQSVLVGGTRAKLNKSILAKIEFSFPSLSEQTRIATILSDMDAELSALEQKLEKYKKVKLGMMQELLTGKTRLL